MAYSAKLFMINLSENFLGFYDRLVVLNEAKYSNDDLNAVFTKLCDNLSAKASSGAIKAAFSLEGSATADSDDHASSEKVKATIRAVVDSDMELGSSVKEVLNSLFNNSSRVASLGFKSACAQVLNDSLARCSVRVGDVSEKDFEIIPGSDDIRTYNMLFDLTLNIVVNAFTEKYSLVYEKISPLSDFAKAGDHRLSAGQFNTLKARLVGETYENVGSVARVLQFYVNAFISEDHTRQLLQNDAFIKRVNEVLQGNNMPKRLDVACQYDFADPHANELGITHYSGYQADLKATAASADKNAISRIEVKILGANSQIKNLHDAEIAFVYRLDQSDDHVLQVYDVASAKLVDVPSESYSWPNFISVSKISESQYGYIAHIEPWQRAQPPVVF